jgi:cytochrome P450
VSTVAGNENIDTRPVAYDPYDYAVHEDPYPTYKRLRDEAPLYHNDELDFWALSRHADVVAAFRDAQAFSSSYGVTLDPHVWGPQAERTTSFLAMDPPRHTRMRALVSRGFTPRRVTELEPHIRELTVRHLEAATAQDTFDFIRDLAGRVPMDVISELVGVPPADRDELRQLADLLVHREEGVTDMPQAGMDAALTLSAYYADMIAARRKMPARDLTSALIDAEIDGDRLTDDEIAGFLFLLIVAGNETTTKLLGNAWYWAWRNPDQRALPFADPGRVPDWVEETLRYDTSTQMLARLARVDVTLHGEVIPAGAPVLLLIGSANRDGRVFREPDAYRLDRDTSEIASFGFGRHFCLGASLARLEARVVLEELVARVADYDVDADHATRVHSVNVRGFASLPNTVTLR